MLSLILPYWDRQEAANNAIALLNKTYAGLDMELVIVDDGNKVPFVTTETDFPVVYVRLPEKDIAKCPATAWNAGAAASNGDFIVLSCIEILHETPVLEKLVEAVEDIGPLGYVLAAAWCPEANAWHCHSTVKVPRNPEGTGIAFCAAMHKELFFKAGGFDEEYREGAGYEDNDWINRLLVAGARFLIRDDLVVTHPKTGASIEWGATRFERNERLFYSKWPTEVRMPTTTFVCLNAGNYCDRGAEYVNNLYDMVARNLSPNIKAKFACLTDNPDGLDKNIIAIQLPSDIAGWWGKLYLFKDKLFPENERMIFLDLDTLIVNNIDKVVSYDGDFATLRDFYNHDVLGPGVMMWRSGACNVIWDEWEAQGRPLNDMGDLWWINSIRHKIGNIDVLQDVLPGEFVSYKQQCTIAPPSDSSIVCFHGLPRPHDVGGWVENVWKVDGHTLSEMEVRNNVTHDTIKNNIDHSSRRYIPWLQLETEPFPNEVLIVGGGPSIERDLEDIRIKQADGAHIIALNGAAEWLCERGIRPNYCAVIDARDSNIKFVDGDFADRYLLASQCDPALFDRTDGYCTLFHIDIPYLGSYVPGDRLIQAVGGGITVGLISLSVAYTLGYRTMHLYGYDSSYSELRHHAYDQPENDNEATIEAHVCGRTFKCAPWMVMQTNQFQELAKQLIELGCALHVHGTGLLPTVAWEMFAASQQN